MLYGLRAALLNQHLIVVGGSEGRYSYTDEVLCGILYLVMITLTSQVFQYDNKSGQWSEMDQKMERGRYYHAIVEANLRAVCPVGNLNLKKESPGKTLGIIINSHIIAEVNL